MSLRRFAIGLLPASFGNVVTSRKTAALAVLFIALVPTAVAQTTGKATPGDTARPPLPHTDKPMLTLSPAVVMTHGKFGQSLTQTLSVSNQTSWPFQFEMLANDVVVKDGKRVFAAAGQTPRGIATSAVFSRNSGLVKPYTMESIDVRVTVPAETDVRAVAIIFHGTAPMAPQTGAVGVMASLGALITFNLTPDAKLVGEPLRITLPTDTTNLAVAQHLSNTGTEPILPDGMVAFLDAKGALVGKVPVTPERLLPGEKLEFKVEYPGQLHAGSYRVLASYQYEGKTLTSEGTFNVP